ncbi:MAG TPA: hypothetical protein VGC76_07555 [Pyrinomonadaceae bacterium]|jgi:hypothetical protein
MTKKDVAWLIVRIIGICFLWNAGSYLFIVFQNLLLAAGASKETLLSEASGLISVWVIEAVVSLILGIYFLKNGKFLFELINSESD